jgi:hypothetical protein
MRTTITPDPGASGPAGFTDAFTLKIGVADSTASPTDAATFAIALAQADSNAGQSETVKLAFPAPDFTDANLTPTEARQLALRCWATGCTTNETATGNNVNPAAANGQNDGVFAQCHTGSGTPPSTVNPNTVTTGSMNVPGGLTIISAQLRMYFKTGAIAAAVADNLNITASSTGGYLNVVWQGPALATLLYPGEDYSVSGLTVNLTGLTLTQLQNMQLKASYTAGILALPQTTIQIDAWAVEIVASI